MAERYRIKQRTTVDSYPKHEPPKLETEYIVYHEVGFWPFIYSGYLDTFKTLEQARDYVEARKNAEKLDAGREYLF